MTGSQPRSLIERWYAQHPSVVGATIVAALLIFGYYLPRIGEYLAGRAGELTAILVLMTVTAFTFAYIGSLADRHVF